MNLKTIKSKKDAKKILESLKLTEEFSFWDQDSRYFIILTRISVLENVWVAQSYNVHQIPIRPTYLTLESAVDFLWQERESYNRDLL